MEATPRLRELLSLFYFLQVLTQRHIAQFALFPSLSSQQNFIARMLQGGLIQSVPLPLSEGGRPPALYFLTNRGAALAAHLCAITEIKTRTSLPPLSRLWHHLAIVEQIVMLKTALPQVKCLAEFNYKFEEGQPKNRSRNRSVLQIDLPPQEQKQRFLIPDFDVRSKGKRWFVEVDLSSESLAVLRDKLQRYALVKQLSAQAFQALVISVPDAHRQKQVMGLTRPEWVQVCLGKELVPLFQANLSYE